MCAALPSSVLCWGGNSNGQLGDSSDAGTATPSLVTGLGYTVELSATSYTTCSRGNDSSIHCWGSGQAGQLGDGMMVDSYVPVSVAGLGGTLAEVSAGEAHACGRTSSGEALCWGDNSEQQIGNSGAGAQISTPIGVSGLATGVVDIHAGRYHTCAITSGGATYCWGANNYGQLGIGTITYQPPITAPVQVVDL
jgi:alpha-tubulin suppressor-like RCC1 family protein